MILVDRERPCDINELVPIQSGTFESQIFWWHTSRLMGTSDMWHLSHTESYTRHTRLSLTLVQLLVDNVPIQTIRIARSQGFVKRFKIQIPFQCQAICSLLILSAPALHRYFDLKSQDKADRTLRTDRIFAWRLFSGELFDWDRSKEGSTDALNWGFRLKSSTGAVSWGPLL